MRLAYALLGLVVGIVLDEAVRRGLRTGLHARSPRRELTLFSSATPTVAQHQPAQPLSRGFSAQDYYDR